MTDRLQAPVRRRRLHLARRPVPRAHRDRQPRRPRQGQATSSGSPPTRRSSPPRSPTASGTTTRSASSPPTAPTSTEAIFELTTEDVRNACDVLLPVYEADRGATAGSRSRSSPTWPTTPTATIASAQELWDAVDRPNVFIKIPATDEGAARDHRRAIAEGISVNVTLIFGLDRYRAVMDAYLAGLEQARDGRPATCPTIHSVASFFVSRVDTEIDKRLDAIGTDEADALQRQGRRRQRPARLRGLRGGLRRRPLAAASRRPAPTRSGRCGPRPASRTRDYPDTHVRHRPGRRRHRQHDAREDPGGRSPTTARSQGDQVTGRATTRRSEVFDGLARRRHRLRRRDRVSSSEGVEKFVKSWDELVETVEGQLEQAQAVSSELTDAGTPSPATAFELFFGYRDEAAFAAPVEQLVADRVASRHRRARTRTLWGPAAEAESAKRLGWVDLSQTSRPLVAEIAALRDELREPGPDPRRALRHGRLVARARGDLRGRRRRARRCSTPPTPTSCAPRSSDRLDATVVVVSSKSGGTVETDSQRRAYEKAFTRRRHRPRRADRRRHRPRLAARRSRPREAGYRVFLADPTSAAATPR